MWWGNTKPSKCWWRYTGRIFIFNLDYCLTIRKPLSSVRSCTTFNFQIQQQQCFLFKLSSAYCTAVSVSAPLQSSSTLRSASMISFLFWTELWASKIGRSPSQPRAIICRALQQLLQWVRSVLYTCYLGVHILTVFCWTAILQLKWAKYGLTNPYDKVLLAWYGIYSFGFGASYLMQGWYLPLVPMWGIPALTWFSQA